MGRRKETQTHVRKLAKFGPYTYLITLPKREVDRLRWKNKQKLTVTRYGTGLLIRDWKRGVGDN